MMGSEPTISITGSRGEGPADEVHAGSLGAALCLGFAAPLVLLALNLLLKQADFPGLLAECLPGVVDGEVGTYS